MTIGERIKSIRMTAGQDGKKMTLEEFGRKIGISNQAVSAIESGKARPSNQTIEFICREFSVNKNWLETGEGAKDAPELDEIAAILGEMAITDSALYDFILKAARKYSRLDDSSKKTIDRFIDSLLN